MKPPKATEGEIHATIAEFLDWVLLPPAMYTTFPAGWGRLGKATAGRLRGAGLKPGMPDILIFHNGRATGIELKAEKGRLSDNQIAMHERLAMAGVRVYVCHTTEEVLAALESASLPRRNLKTEAA